MAKGLKKGLLITFEGTEGCGKSTQSRMLTGFLRREGFRTSHIWDPGNTKLGESVRNILLTPGKNFCAESEMLLYLAARAQLVNEKIIPALKEKRVIICDRFIDATVAYQGYGLGVDKKAIDKFNLFVTDGISPDVTFFLNASVKEGLNRSRNVKGFSDRIERRSYDFHKRVRRGYLAQAKKHKKRIKVVEVEKNTKEETQKILRSIVLDVIKENNRAR